MAARGRGTRRLTCGAGGAIVAGGRSPGQGRYPGRNRHLAAGSTDGAHNARLATVFNDQRRAFGAIDGPGIQGVLELGPVVRYDAGGRVKTTSIGAEADQATDPAARGTSWAARIGAACRQRSSASGGAAGCDGAASCDGASGCDGAAACVRAASSTAACRSSTRTGACRSSDRSAGVRRRRFS
jgi:hypothetical protein